MLHRSKANKNMMPTYQRIIKKKRLNEIYDFIENQNILVGRKSKRIFRIGDQLRVQVIRADKTTMEIDFSIAREKESRNNKKKTASSNKSRTKEHNGKKRKN